jgi:hypothetical protein
VRRFRPMLKGPRSGSLSCWSRSTSSPTVGTTRTRPMAVRSAGTVLGPTTDDGRVVEDPTGTATDRGGVGR